MLNDVHVIEEVIEYLRDQLPKDIPLLLKDSEFNRGKAAQLHEIIDSLERLADKVDEDLLSHVVEDSHNEL